MANKKEKFASIFSDKTSESVANAHLMPLYLSSTYIYPSVSEAQAVFEGKKEGTIYGSRNCIQNHSAYIVESTSRYQTRLAVCCTLEVERFKISIQR